MAGVSAEWLGVFYGERASPMKLELFRLSCPEFKDRNCLLSGPVSGTTVAKSFADGDIMFDVQDRSLSIQPYNVEGYFGVFHPKGPMPQFLKNK